MADGVYKLPFVVRYFSCLQLFRTGAPALVPPRSCDLYCSWCVGVGGKLGRFLDQISLWSGFSAFSPVLLVYQIDDGRIQPDRIPTLRQEHNAYDIYNTYMNKRLCVYETNLIC